MVKYRYEADDLSGERIEDVIEANTAHRARRILEERGLSIHTLEELNAPRGVVRVSERLDWDDIALLCQHLESIVRHRLPLPEALRVMAEDLKSSKLAPVLDSLRRDLEAGRSLDEAVDRQHRAFPRHFAPLLRAGEATGNMGAVLQLMANYAGAQLAARQAMRQALAYPIITLLLASGVVLFLLIKVVPIFAEIFREFGGELPLPTKLLVSISNFVIGSSGAAIMAVIILCALVVALRFASRRLDSLGYWLEYVFLKIPLIGRVFYQAAIARFSRTFSMLLEARVPVLESMELAAASSGSRCLERATAEATLGVAAGGKIAECLQSTGFFKRHYCWLLGTGEERGDMFLALDTCAENAERDAGLRTRTLNTILPQFVIIVTGFLIAAIVISLYLPIFTLGDAVSGT